MSDLALAYGLVLDPWQEDVLRAGLGERSNGDWAVRQLGLSTPRQNGKTQLIVARVLAGLLLFGERIIVVSAHRQDTARETFFRLVQIIEDNPSLEERVDFIARSEMREFIRLKTGQEVRFKARSSGSGRGFSCDCLMLDEAQILGAGAWSAILPTMSARPNPQVWLLGTPPTPLDDGEVFSRIRDVGIAGSSSRVAYLEWSAAEGDDLDDPGVWAKANPAFGLRISHEAIAVERASMSDDQFQMERLGMWSAARVNRVIPADAWADVADTSSVPVDAFALGVEVGPDMGWASLSLAGLRADGGWHVELQEHRQGVDWVVPTVAAYVGLNPQVRAVVADAGSPVAGLFDDFERARVRLTMPKVRELGSACQAFLAGVVTGQVRHIGQPQVNVAAGVAGKRPLGDTGMWVWSRKSAAADITPIQAATLALWGAQSLTVKRPGRRTGQGRRVVTTC